MTISSDLPEFRFWSKYLTFCCWRKHAAMLKLTDKNSVFSCSPQTIILYIHVRGRPTVTMTTAPFNVQFIVMIFLLLFILKSVRRSRKGNFLNIFLISDFYFTSNVLQKKNSVLMFNIVLFDTPVGEETGPLDGHFISNISGFNCIWLNFILIIYSLSVGQKQLNWSELLLCLR